MKFMVRCLRSVLILFLYAIPALCQSRVECGALKSRILNDAVHYCALLPPGYDSVDPKHPAQRFPVLYFLHGLGDNEQTLVKSGGLSVIDDFRVRHKIGNFIMVTPEARASFYVNSADGKVRYSDFFLQEFIPHIETKFRIDRERQARAITGISMGGYGALRFAFAHPELFSAVSAQSAALMTESAEELNAAARAGSPKAKLLGSVFGTPVNAKHWKENDPILLAEKNRVQLRGLAIYFNCGDRDDFQFDVGAKKLDQELQAEGIKHEFHLYPGRHDADYFYSHLGEVLEFHSKAFAASNPK
jgi:S-formylglutathione hydrolase FrmB